MTVRVVVDSRVRLALRDLGEQAAEAVQSAFAHPNPEASKDPGEPAIIRTWAHERDEAGAEWLTAPRGGMARVRAALRAAGQQWSVEDRRTWRFPEPGFPDHRRDLWAHQRRMVDAAERVENCLLEGATGSGKTSALYALLAGLKRRALVMVWTENLLKQWRERAIDELGLDEEDVGVVQGGEERIRPLTLAMQQTIASRFERGDGSLARAFDVVCCDEVQRMAARTCYAAVDPFAARYRVGVSADHTRHDGLDFLVRDLFGEVVERVGEDETIAAGHTVDVEVRVVPTGFAADWYGRSIRAGGWRARQAWNRLLDQMVADERRNELALSIARRVVARGEQVVLFTHRVEHARQLDARLCAEGIASGAMVGGAKDGVAFDRTKAGILSGELRAAVGTYQAIAQGLDLPSVEVGVCVTPMGNNRQQLGQVRGRICRASDGKLGGVLYYLLDAGIFHRKPVANFVRWFRTVSVLDGGGFVEAREWLKRSVSASAA